MYQLLDETDDFLVIDKAPGVSVHKDQLELGLAMAIKQDLKLDQLFPVHRLDKITSGVMVFAKNHSAASELSEQFRLKRVEKFYLALSCGKPKRKQGAVVGDMQKSRRGAWKLLRSQDNAAITQFFSLSLKPGFRLFLLKPTTGKTHQIRVALKSEGAPILGDQLYVGGEADRTYLHAYSLNFQLNGKPYSYKVLPTAGAYFDSDCREKIEQHFSTPAALNWPRVKIKGGINNE